MNVIDRDISSFLDESHAPLDQSVVGMDHAEYMDDIGSTSQKSKRPNGPRTGKKKGKKAASKPASKISEEFLQPE